MDIVERIRAECELFAGINRKNMKDGDWRFPAPLFHQFLLRNGRVMSAATLPENMKAGPPRACFSNSYEVAKEYNVHYCEGYADAGFGILIHHAWNIDENDVVIDTTWDDAEKCQYFGISLPFNELEEEIERNGKHAILGFEMANREFMYRLDPFLKALFEGSVKNSRKSKI